MDGLRKHTYVCCIFIIVSFYPCTLQKLQGFYFTLHTNSAIPNETNRPCPYPLLSLLSPCQLFEAVKTGRFCKQLWLTTLFNNAKHTAAC